MLQRGQSEFTTHVLQQFDMTAEISILADGAKGEAADADHAGHSDAQDLCGGGATLVTRIQQCFDLRTDFQRKLLSEAASIQTIDDFKHWTRASIRPIFPHETLGCGYGRIHAGGVGVDGIITVDYPIEHLKSICNKAGGLDTPILRRWLATREPQLFEAEFPWEETPPEWLEQFRHHDLRNTAAHAVYDSERCIGTYINFHRIPGRLGPGHIEALKLLAPIMHDVICRLIGDMNEASKLDKLRATLSEGERQVLELVARGKVNAEIASVLSISEDAVKHRVTRIFKKFGIENRIQLTRLCVEHEFRMQTEYGLKVR